MDEIVNSLDRWNIHRGFSSVICAAVNLNVMDGLHNTRHRAYRRSRNTFCTRRYLDVHEFFPIWEYRRQANPTRNSSLCISFRFLDLRNAVFVIDLIQNQWVW